MADSLTREQVLVTVRIDAAGRVVVLRGGLSGALAAALAGFDPPDIVGGLQAILSAPPVSYQGEWPADLVFAPGRDVHPIERPTDAVGGLLIFESTAAADGGALITVSQRLPVGVFDPATLQRILDLLPATVSVKDANRRYLFVNKAWETYANVSRGAVLARSHEEIAAPCMAVDQRAAHSRDIADRDGYVLATGKALLGQEERYMLADGDERTLLSNKLPLFDHHGRVTGILSITMDVSDMVRAQALLEQARRAAEAASRVKTEFLATMSHELRTPLNGVLGLTSLLEESGLRPEQAEWAKGVSRSAAELLHMLDSILRFVEQENTPSCLQREDIDLAALVEDVTARFAEQAKNKGLMINTIISQSARKRVFIDPYGLSDVLNELIDNAITFTHEGSVDVDVQIEQSSDNIFTLRIDVIDTGVGIATTEANKLFSPFYQANQSSTRQHGGVGMGLAVCRRTVEAMGGALTLAVPRSKGSTFRLLLNVDVLGERSDVIHMVSGERVLVAGRQATDRNTLAQRFVSAGALVDQVGDPAAALSLAASASASGSRLRLLVVDGEGANDADLDLYERVCVLFGAPRIPMILVGGPPKPSRPDIIHVPAPVSEESLITALNLTTSEKSGDHQPISAAPPPPLPSAPAPAPNSSTNADRKMRILLAEDNEVNQLVAVGMLNSLGYTVDVASNGADAVTAMETGGYDLVLMDVRMPVMDGLEATRRIRALGGQAGAIPIIAVTANAMRGDEEACLNAGMNDYMAKPIRLATLDAALKRWLSIS